MAPHPHMSAAAMNVNVNAKKKDSRIVKIALKESGDAGPFRRVGLMMLNGSHQRLCEAAAELAAVDTPNAKVVAYKLKLTYKDEEDDHCLLLNDKDVQLAIVGRTTPLKIFADIIEFSAVSKNPPCVVQKSPPLKAAGGTRNVEPPATAATTFAGTTNQHSPALHQAVESIVGVVADAVVGLQAALPEKRKSTDIAPEVSADAEPAAPPAAVPELPSQVTPKSEAAKTTQATTMSDMPEWQCETCLLINPKLERQCLACGAIRQPSLSIHPRHTCDACRTCPIVGTRYHATNMVDFDLCATCYDNKDSFNLKNELGQAVQFEALEPKLPIRMPTATPTEESSTTTPSEPWDQDRPFIHGRHTCDSCLVTPIVGKRYHAKNMLDFDLCEFCHANYMGTDIEFEEAELDQDRPFQERWNRRFNRYRMGRHDRRRGHRGGLRRWGGPPTGPFPCGTPPFPHAPPHAGPFSPPPHVPPPIDPPPFKGSSPPAFFGNQCSTQGNSDTAAPREPEDAPLKEAIRRSLEDQETQAGGVKKEAETQTEQKTTNSEGVQTEAPEPEIVVGVSPMPTDVSNTPNARKSPTSTGSPVVDDSTFASEAAGNGDVATVLGETMDRIASAIQEMNLEIERECNRSSASNESDDDTDSEIPLAAETMDGTNNSHIEVVVETVNEDEEKTGDVIISGETIEEDSASQNSWDVVEHQTDNDESLARAAYEIGSALFNSGMTPNAPANDSNVSVATLDSVPTTLPSLESETQIPLVLLERWAGHLQRMHELGFYNDVLAVETLERLQAANIGSDESEEITVQRLVNELVKD